MQYFTLVFKTVNCPMWKDNIHITAKYRYLEDKENPYLARFVGATCEVIENARLPEHKKDKRLSLYRFCRIQNCQHLRNFQDIIDVRLNHRES